MCLVYQVKTSCFFSTHQNIDGESHFKEWFGVSFQTLANQIRPFLAQKSLNSGLSKWIVFARDFLLHLDNFYEIEVINMDIIDFVIKNHTEIQKLFKIREQAYEEIKKDILKILDQKFTGSKFRISNEKRFKNSCRGWRFSCCDLESNSDIVLYLNFDTTPIVEVWLCLELPKHDKSVKGKLDSILKRSNSSLKSHINWAKSDEDTMTSPEYRRICWEFNHFNLDEISHLIIYTQETINKFN